MRDLDFTELNRILESGTKEELDAFVSENNLKIKEGKIVPNNKDEIQEAITYWDKRQLVKKILLNSLYGGLLNQYCRFYDKRMGQSTTLTGRRINRHMARHINQTITGDYDHEGESIIYGDSVTGDAMIELIDTKVSIQELFNKYDYKQHGNGKDYAIIDDSLMVLGYNSYEMLPELVEVGTIMRHKTTKQLYKITAEDGSTVTVTEDHSLIVDRGGYLTQVKPQDLLEDDLLISASSSYERQKVKKIEKLPPSDEYVYDISVKEGDHYFFANDLLVKNTDSVYFSATKTLKKEIENGDIDWNKDNVVTLYDSIADEVNHSFPSFMKRSFNTPQERGEIIKCGREIVASSGLFITKKRYAVMVYDKEGSRKDTNGKPGSIKAMGMDLKRSDTPAFMQDFLMSILHDILTNVNKDIILDKVKVLKQELYDADPWTLGTPKRVNKLTMYTQKEKANGKINMPGHVRAAKNWNTLRDMNGDVYSMEIQDGQKTIVCKMQKNPMDFTSVAYPIDEQHLPQWFKDLPFDKLAMLHTIVDNKVENLVRVLKWDLSVTDVTNSFNDLFSFA